MQEGFGIAMNVQIEYGKFLLSVDKDSVLKNMLPFHRGFIGIICV